MAIQRVTTDTMRPAWLILVDDAPAAPATNYEDAKDALPFDGTEAEDVSIGVNDFVCIRRPYREDFYAHVEAVDEAGGTVSVWSKRLCAGGTFPLGECMLIVKAAALTAAETTISA